MSASENLTTTVSTKGQVILPKAIREQRRWVSGTKLSVEDTPNGVLLKASPVFAETTIDAVFGSMPPAGPTLSVEEMHAVITREAKKHARD